MNQAELLVFEPPNGQDCPVWLQPRGQLRFFWSEWDPAPLDPFEESINVCDCGEPIPEEVGHCWECRDWDVALERKAAYDQALSERLYQRTRSCVYLWE